MRFLATVCAVYIFVACSCLHAGEASAYNILVDQSGVYHDAGVATWLRQQGNTVTAVSNFNGTGADLNRFDIVMDFGYDRWSGLNAGKVQAYSDYLKHGGGLYLQGEKPTNPDYLSQDYSVINFIAAMGGGTVSSVSTSFLKGTNELVLPSPIKTTATQFFLDEGLGITNPGNGFKIVYSNNYIEIGTWQILPCDMWSSMIGYDFGDLTLAPNSRMVANFDITPFSMAQFDYTNQFLFNDIVDYLGDVSVTALTPVPEPSTAVYFLIPLSGIGLFAFAQRFTSRKKQQG